jgi:hypothetical protein
MIPSDLDSAYDVATHTRLSPTPSHLSEHELLCYFTYIPTAPSNHWSLETPLPSPDLCAKIVADPHNPLLALRIPLSSPSQTMEASKLLQLQTAAAHSHHNSQPPQPQPHQDVLELSNDSMSSRDSSGSNHSFLCSVRRICSRCQITYGDFISYSLNSYYCTRCAKITGLIGG